MSSTAVSRIIGRVKWFNSKAGYGFITACEGELVDKDIFVHFSSIKSDAFYYKYLTQGEYVEFSLTKPENEKHEYHAVDITGVKGGPILCETRRLNAAASRPVSEGGDNAGEQEAPVVASTPAPVRARKPRVATEKPASAQGQGQTDSDGFTPVKGKVSLKKRAPSAKSTKSSK
jgi:cold shock CspA family protein